MGVCRVGVSLSGDGGQGGRLRWRLAARRRAPLRIRSRPRRPGAGAGLARPRAPPAARPSRQHRRAGHGLLQDVRDGRRTLLRPSGRQRGAGQQSARSGKLLSTAAGLRFGWSVCGRRLGRGGAACRRRGDDERSTVLADPPPAATHRCHGASGLAGADGARSRRRPHRDIVRGGCRARTRLGPDCRRPRLRGGHRRGRSCGRTRRPRHNLRLTTRVVPDLAIYTRQHQLDTELERLGEHAVADREGPAG